MPLEHLPGWRGDAGSGAAQEILRETRIRGELLFSRRRGSARADGAPGDPEVQRSYRPGEFARYEEGDRALEGEGSGLLEDLPDARHAGASRALQQRAPEPRPGKSPGQPAERACSARARAER